MAILLVDRAKMTTATTGTGTITLGSAVSGFQTFASAGVTNGSVVRYAIDDGTNWEIGTGTYTASGTTLTRAPTASNNGGAAISLSGSAVVYVTASAADITAMSTAAAITSGTIDGATVGATTPSTGHFTALTADGQVNLGTGTGTSNRTWATGSNEYGYAQVSSRSYVSGNANPVRGAFCNYFKVTDVLNNSGGQCTNALVVDHFFGGSGSSGGRQGFLVNFTQSGANSVNTPPGTYRVFNACQVYADFSYNEGGTNNTSASNSAVGGAISFSTSTYLHSGATNFQTIMGYELDLCAQTGSSFCFKLGMMIVKAGTDAVKGGDGYDTAFSIHDSPGATAPWDYGITFGRNAFQWPFGSTSILIHAQESQTVSGTYFAIAKRGVDFSNVIFNDAAFKSIGFSVDGNGNIIAGNDLYLGNYSLKTLPSGLVVDATSQTALTFSVAAGGTGWHLQDKLTTATGGYYQVSAVSGTAVTALTQLVPDVSASPPANPVATTPTNNNVYHTGGSGLTLNLTWTASNQLSLAPTGTVIAPTPTAGDNSTKVATTAFVANALTSSGSSATSGAWMLQWTGGEIVANGTYWFAFPSPYNGTIYSMDWVTTGGTFTANVEIAGISVTGLSAVNVNSATASNTTATANNAFTSGQVVQVVITGVTGSPTSAALSLRIQKQ